MPSPSVDASARAGSGSAYDSTLRELWPGLLALLRREPALGLTGVYLLVAMAGLFHSYRYYAQFDIPILSLLQVGDFLTAGVQEPMALLLVLSTLPIVWLFDAINVRVRGRMRRALARLPDIEAPNLWQRLRRGFLQWQTRRRDAYLRFMYAGILFGYGWVFVSIYADHQVQRIREGQGRRVQVFLADGQSLAAADGSALRYLGAVAGYVFLFDGSKAQILPVQAISRIEPIPGAKASNSHKGQD